MTVSNEQCKRCNAQRRERIEALLAVVREATRLPVQQTEASFWHEVDNLRRVWPEWDQQVIQ